MTRVRQTFTNKLPEDVVIWLEPDCWCWLLKPGEKLTADFDINGSQSGWEPLPISLSTDNRGAEPRFMLVLWQQGKTEISLFIDGNAIEIDGIPTQLGLDRMVIG